MEGRVRNMHKVISAKYADLDNNAHVELLHLVNDSKDKILVLDREGKTPVSCYHLDKDTQLYIQFKCVALAVFDGALCVLYERYFEDSAYKGRTAEELLEDDGWETIDNGLFLKTATLSSIAGGVGEYLPKHITDMTVQEVLNLRDNINLVTGNYSNNLNVDEAEAEAFFERYYGYIRQFPITEDSGDDISIRKFVVNKYDTDDNLAKFLSSYE